MRRRRRRYAGQGLALSIALGVVACGTSTASSAAAKTLPLPSGASYVSMGSSYGAGYDITPQESGDGLCGRSLVDYPHLVAKKLHLKLDDVTCGGAVTANALNNSQDGHPPQIDAVTAKTRLVTITIGGNDVDYNATAIECGVVGPACTAAGNRKAMNANFRKLPHSLESLISAIRSKAPAVTIVLVTYPRLVPPSPCADLNYTPAASRMVASIGARLEKVFVKVARATNIRLADPYVLGAKHGPCAAGANRWIVGLVPDNGAPYHPTAAGHREMARLVERALTSSHVSQHQTPA
jgi:lysophospholipase L1-like esterase